MKIKGYQLNTVDLDDIKSPRIRELVEWYDALPREGEQWPTPESFKPQTIPPKTLPHIGKVTVETNPFRVFYRAVGTTICESLGMNVSGKYLDETGLPQTRDLEDIYRFLIRHNDYFFIKSQQTVMGQEFDYEGCALPFGNKNEELRTFVIAEDYLPEEIWKEALRKRSYAIKL